MATAEQLSGLQRDALVAHAHMFAAVAEHGTIIGTAREIALAEFCRALLPRRYEVLSGAISDATSKARGQLDLMVVDTMDFPVVVRTGDLAIVHPESVSAVIEVKSELARGEVFQQALNQIGYAKEVAGKDTFTCLYCFGAPARSATLRDWLNDTIEHRNETLQKASRARKQSRKDELRESVSAFSASKLPDLIACDNGAIASLSETTDDGVTTSKYLFHTADDEGKGKSAATNAATAAFLASRLIFRISRNSPAAQRSLADPAKAFAALGAAYAANIKATDDEPITITDLQPKK